MTPTTPEVLDARIEALKELLLSKIEESRKAVGVVLALLAYAPKVTGP